ncbi:hypothetical protein EJ06DRAFT_519405 [Trichodelitschia bisporula]|uniref:Nudix hydrolase domain-containing protein n=1 Tax=Trichodelitschia bisporula TaxID=703511 RepID=A0A6G1I6J5_9PEZI|nr:hypothetical protein EJ06DRAFT_519405 [Trichodelitschia bisporula]
MPTASSQPLLANFPSNRLVSGAGAAIFHVKTMRVVVCYHTVKKYWFLPKGRRDAGEESTVAAQREGFEESGYRNRLLPLPVSHRQPRDANPSARFPYSRCVIEPVWTQLIPLTINTQYLLHWYIAETLDPEAEVAIGAPSREVGYQAPPAYPDTLRLCDRILMEPEDYEPTRYEGTGVDDEEAQYTAKLLPVDEALRLLRGTVMADVVKVGRDLILDRMELEA